MPLSTLVWLAGVALAVLVGGAVRRWARSLPVAYGWNPETHDRQACIALDILRADERLGEPVTLFGWVLRQLASPHHGLWTDYVGQIRRGSIEEDMNSHAINEFEAVSAAADSLLSEGARLGGSMTSWLWVVLLAKKAAGAYLENVEGISGTNGGYHYYNPMVGDDSRAGLSEPTYIATVLSWASKKIGSGTLKPPMPSAVTRALDSSSRVWSFDYEGRNYTYDDAQRYCRMGYPALGLYALGRMLHLLQDMAVPAHVRDDSHLGLELPGPLSAYGEPGEPLEKLAGNLDWAATSPPGDPGASNTVKWSYVPGRTYNTVGSDLYDLALNEYRGVRAGSKGAAPREHFLELARSSHRTYYCLGTIPGNPDAHNPNDTSEQPWLRKGSPVDWKKCAPNVEGLVGALSALAGSTRGIMDAYLPMLSLYDQRLLSYSGDASQLTILRGQVETARQHGREVLLTIDQQLLPQAAAAAKSHDRFTTLVDSLIQVGKRIAGLTDPNPNYSPYSSSYWSHALVTAFQARAAEMELERLALVARRAPDTTEALRDYIRGFGDDEQRLAKAFEPTMPFVITPEMYRAQYWETTPRAAARCAALMADWFESLYAPGENRGIGVWQNADAENGAIPLEYRVAPTTDATPVKTYGVANHLPAPVEMTCELTLVELTDARTGASVTDREVSVDVILGHVSPAHLGSAPAGPTGAPLKPGQLDLRGREDHAVVVGHREKGSFAFGTVPHALGTQKAYAWPAKGAWGAGAIRREEEAEKLQPVNLTPGQAPGGVGQGGRDDLFATFLRLSAHLVPEEKEPR
ncbi:MAG: hypothetical protein GX649_16120 [Chloroflexi bacterium]|nr:hypothetical protein [Chloroflexota bacterium]